MIGEPDAGKLQVRFDEGMQETCGYATRLRPTLPRRCASRNFFKGKENAARRLRKEIDLMLPVREWARLEMRNAVISVADG